MFPPNAQNLYCPGCAAGDVTMPHICNRQFPRPLPSPTQPALPLGRCDEHCFCNDSLIVNGKPHVTCCMCGTRRVK